MAGRAVLLLLLASAGCGAPTRLYVPQSELDHVGVALAGSHVEGDRVHVVGWLKAPADRDLMVDVGKWRLLVPGRTPIPPIACDGVQCSLYELKRGSAAWVSVDFAFAEALDERGARLVVAGITESGETMAIGEIPLSTEPLADDIAVVPHPEASDVLCTWGRHRIHPTLKSEPSADLRLGACGSGPGITCPR